jgi:thiol-disulfide isomerase/thioredoxin
MRAFSFWLLSLVLATASYGQGKVVFRGHVHFDAASGIRLISPVKDCVSGSFEQLAVINLGVGGGFSYAFPLASPTMIFIKLTGASHEVYVRPGDTVEMEFYKLDKADTTASWMTTDINFEKLVFTGRQASRFGLIDSLQKVTGTLSDVPFAVSGDVAEFKVTNDLNYRERYNFVLQYMGSAGMDDERMRDCILLEIKGASFSNLIRFYIFKGFDRAVFSPDYFGEIEKENFKWSDAALSRHYMSAAHGVSTYYCPSRLNSGTSDERLMDELECIRNGPFDERLRDYLLTSALLTYMERRPANFEDVLNIYDSLCTDSAWRSAVDGRYDIQVRNNKIGIPDSVLESSWVIAPNGKRIALKELMPAGKPCLIDFWATWCGPCLYQLPYMKKFEDHYGAAIKFIYLSMDKEIGVWRSEMAKRGDPPGQYFLAGGFSSPLARYFVLKSIPRSLLTDRSSKIYSSRVVSPLDAGAFEKTLKDCLSL